VQALRSGEDDEGAQGEGTRCMSALVELGVHMWKELDPTFQHVAQSNGATLHAPRAQLYAGFLHALAGAMSRDLGGYDTKVLLQSALNGVDELARKAGH
jgi:hypothetical protein